MLDHEWDVHRFRMVEIVTSALLRGEVREILIIVILRNQDRTLLGEGRNDSSSERGFASACASANTDD
jgi:hypothetical protein